MTATTQLKIRAEAFDPNGGLAAKFLPMEYQREAIAHLLHHQPGKVTVESNTGKTVYFAETDSIYAPPAPLEPGVYTAKVIDVTEEEVHIAIDLAVEGSDRTVVREFQKRRWVRDPGFHSVEGARIARLALEKATPGTSPVDPSKDIVLDPGEHKDWAAYEHNQEARTLICLGILRAAQMEYPGLCWEIAVPVGERVYNFNLENVNPGKQADRYRIVVWEEGMGDPKLVEDINSDEIALDGFEGILEGLA